PITSSGARRAASRKARTPASVGGTIGSPSVQPCSWKSSFAAKASSTSWIALCNVIRSSRRSNHARGLQLGPRSLIVAEPLEDFVVVLADRPHGAGRIARLLAEPDGRAQALDAILAGDNHAARAQEIGVPGLVEVEHRRVADALVGEPAIPFVARLRRESLGEERLDRILRRPPRLAAKRDEVGPAERVQQIL